MYVHERYVYIVRGDYNNRPSANICLKLEMADQSRECSAILLIRKFCKLIMKFQLQFIYLEQPTIKFCTCGLTNVRQASQYYNHP